MFEKLLSAALARPTVLRRLVEEELERLQEGGYLEKEDVEGLAARAVERRAESGQAARGALVPMLAGLSAQVREALDIPSRAEILALTEALRRAEATGAAAAGAPGEAAGAAPAAGGGAPPEGGAPRSEGA